MLPYGPNHASDRPQRANSSSSVKLRPMVSTKAALDNSGSADQDALMAANLAYERANERNSAHRPVDRISDRETKEIRDSRNADDRSHLGRKQSIRFASPTAAQSTSRPITRREAPEPRDNLTTSLHSLPNGSQNYASLPPSLKELITALPEDFGEGNVASVPSSYRKLRKAKSMFNPRKTSISVFPDGASDRKSHFQRHSSQPPEKFESTRITYPSRKGSNSFLHGVTSRYIPANRQYAAHDAAIQLARDTYLRQVQQQRLKEKPSFLDLTGRHRSRKAFRRTVRSSSTNDYGSAAVSPLPSAEESRTGGLSAKARNFSQAWRTKIGKIFRKQSSGDGVLPAQQIDANLAHYGDKISVGNEVEQFYPPTLDTTAELLQRSSSQESLVYRENSHVDKGSYAGSLRSVRNDDEENPVRSRVSSWTNSTAANTIVAPHIAERKRLSVIKEDGGPHQSSLTPRPYGDLIHKFASFRQPVRQLSNNPIETQRIVSALNKKINENNRQIGLEGKGSDTAKDSNQQCRENSSLPRHISLSGRMGIDLENNSDACLHTLKDSESTTLRPLAKSSHDESNSRSEMEMCREGYTELSADLTPQQLTGMNEISHAIVRRPLREVKSAFFPPVIHIERSSTSPFRLAMHSRIEHSRNNQARELSLDSQLDDNNSNSSIRLRCGSATLSESVYSRSPGGHGWKLGGSSYSLARSESSDEASTAVITTSDSMGKEQSNRSPQNPNSASCDPNGWRLSMSTQVTSLGDPTSPEIQIDDAVPPKDSGHKRENAQLDGDDVIVGRSQVPTNVTKQPIGVIHAFNNYRLLPNQNSSRPMVERVPFKRRDACLNGKNIHLNEHIFANQTSIAFRRVSRNENEKPSSKTLDNPFRDLRTKTSQASFALQKEQNSPSSRILRHSPNRSERLRRLKSGSALSLRKQPCVPKSEKADDIVTNNRGQERNIRSGTPANLEVLRITSNQSLADKFAESCRPEVKMSQKSDADTVFL